MNPYIFLNIASDGTTHLIGAIVALAGAVGFMFKLYDSFRKEERNQLIMSYDKQLVEKNEEIAALKADLQEVYSRENKMSDKLIKVLEATNNIARDNFKVHTNG